MPYEGGLDCLASIPTLEYLNIAVDKPKLTKDSPEIQKLLKARPELTIHIGNNKLGKPRDITSQDEHYKWGIITM